MRKIVMITMTLILSYTNAQNLNENPTIQRKGFIIGVSVGVGALTLKTNDTLNTSFSTTLPNLKVGYMLNDKFALYTMFPGANYKYKVKDRGFEGVILAGQYWIRDKWWVLGGAGFTFDAPAFYTVKDPETAGFYKGFPAFAFATGYEVYQKKKFTIDLQYRIFLGQSNLDNNGKREGVSNMFTVGFNWY